MTATVLDRQRLGKQRVECLQILKTLKKGEFYCPSCNMTLTHFNPHKTGYHCYNCEMPLKRTAWYNHPAVQQWRGYEQGLMLYLKEICREWVNRGYKDTCWEKALEIVPPKEPVLLPNWFGNESFHASHRAALLAKNPEWYEQFAWKETPKIEYIWPVA